MKYLLLIPGFFLFMAGIVKAQNENPDSDNIKLEKQQMREAQKEHNKKIAYLRLMQYDSLLRTRQWVVEANTIYDRYNRALPVNSNLNFVSLRDSILTIQLSVSNTMPGANGVGGVTFEGNVNRYELSNKTGKFLYLHCSAMTPVVGNSDLFINVYDNGRASARVTDIQGNRYSFEGYIVSYQKSKVFKGMRTF